MASLRTLLRTNMRNIVVILICLSLPIQITATLGLAATGSPFCYDSGQYISEEDRNSDTPNHAVFSDIKIKCTWEIGALFKLFFILPVTIITLPIVLNVFLIHYVKKIVKILICLTIPIQILMIFGIVVEGAPFCYWGIHQLQEDSVYIQQNSLQCYWEIYPSESYLLLPVIIVTLPVMLAVFLIHYVKNRRRV